MAQFTSSQRTYEFRCPVHGFIEVNDWERSVIDHPAFQRLRRIRQLGWTDQVYPGSTHTRFEHSLGVMHVVTRMYNAIWQRSGAVLRSHLDYDADGVGRRRDRQMMRFAALLHDIGHAPFSHASEDLLPNRPTKKKYGHEDYSAQIIRHRLKDVIESHPANENMEIKSDQIASLIDGTSRRRRTLFWRELLDGQMDADRMDYLLRDSLHLGVQYGRYDLDRIVATATVVEMRREDSDDAECRLAITEGGWHAAVGLILARYFMFTQVYFHKTRVAFDIHLREALAHLLPDSIFPPPEGDGIDEYLKWDDWRVLGQLVEDKGGEHGQWLRQRHHFRQIWESPESPLADAQERLDRLRLALGGVLAAVERSEKSWYKTGNPDIQVATEDSAEVRPLSDYSPVIKQLKDAPHRQVRLYARPENADRGRHIVQKELGSTS